MKAQGSVAGAGSTAPPARAGAFSWGLSWRQRLRLAPLFLAQVAADFCARLVPPAAPPRLPPWQDGISIVIPERDAPAMLGEALASLQRALAAVPGPAQVIVVVNGADPAAYAELRRAYPDVQFDFSSVPLGFGAAVLRGLALARHDWTYLQNNDMTLEPGALAAVLAARAPDVFAVASQIFQRNAAGRREETGFTDWYTDHRGLQLFHAPPPADAAVRPHLCASGGAALFRTSVLRRYVQDSRCYDPFYWEDVEWGVRAWRDGLAVLFCPDSYANHRHRATASRFYAAEEIERIVERNRCLFDARQGVTGNGVPWLMDRICDLPYASQRELSRPAVAVAVFRQRLASRRLPQPLAPPALADPHGGPTTLPAASYSYHLRAAGGRKRVLVVTPFAVFPPRHGGARRVAETLKSLAADHDVILVSDEAQLYDAGSFAHMDGLAAVHLVQRGAEAPGPADPSLDARRRTHCHPGLVAAVDAALDRHAPGLVVAEHFELADLVARKRPGQHWLLDLHDAYGPADFADAGAAERFATDVLAAFDAVTVCSDEDRALVAHPRAVTVPNGSAIPLAGYRPSTGEQLLFVGPFRYPQNLAGILAFVRDAWPATRAARPEARLLILGGYDGPAIARGHPSLVQPGIEVAGHRDDVAAILAASALSINPLHGIRGSAVKLIESLSAGRVCVSTDDAARGFGAAGFAGLVTVRGVAAMAAPVIVLLADADARHRREAPDPAQLARFQWDACLAPQRALVAALLAPDAGAAR